MGDEPHPPPRAIPARCGGNPSGEELHGTGATRTATVRSHNETGRTRHTHANHTPQAMSSLSAGGRWQWQRRKRRRRAGTGAAARVAATRVLLAAVVAIVVMM